MSLFFAYSVLTLVGEIRTIKMRVIIIIIIKSYINKLPVTNESDQFPCTLLQELEEDYISFNHLQFSYESSDD